MNLESAPSVRPRGSSRVRLCAWALLTVILLFTTLVRIRLREAPLERDEGEYAYAGQLLLQGIPPYQLAYNMKFPGIYLAYAAMMAAFGESAAGIHLGFILVNAAAILLVYLLTTRLANRSPAWWPPRSMLMAPSASPSLAPPRMPLILLSRRLWEGYCSS